mmetsp:Transcript_12171/g.42199  ORF Transcript_12171/g.42199 Transcript_12171/m.42199 type:complete len:105 (-) Transcript_12171:224-538(-)
MCHGIDTCHIKCSENMHQPPGLLKGLYLAKCNGFINYFHIQQFPVTWIAEFFAFRTPVRSLLKLIFCPKSKYGFLGTFGFWKMACKAGVIASDIRARFVSKSRD